MMPLVDIKTQYQTIRSEVEPAIARVLESGQVILGPEVARFEQEFAAYCQAREAVGVNSGTSALHLALLAAGVKPGDEVITVPFTFVATVAAIRYVGATPVFVDVEPRSLTMDVSRLEHAVTPRTKVIIPVHLYGQAADMDPILDVARRRGLLVIEDAAQAHGALYHGRRVGGLGDLGCFSFYAGKNLGAYGEGGMVVTNNPTYAQTIRMLRDWGQERKYHHVMLGYNYRLEALQAAILSVKLRHLEAWNAARQAHAQRYDQRLRDSGVQTPVTMPSRQHVYHLYTVRTPQRDELQGALAAAGIQTGIHYPIPVHRQPAYADVEYPAGAFPHAEQAAQEVLSLPMYPELTPDDIDLVASTVVAWGRAAYRCVS